MKKYAKISKYFNYLLQLFIIVLTYSYLYREVFFRKDFQTIVHSVSEFFHSVNFRFYSILVGLLMLVNWLLEAFKWKYMIRKIEKVSIQNAFTAVLSGISVSVFTPNRTGEYFGRVFILQKARRWDAVFITILGSMCQLLVTILMGSMGLLLFFPFVLREFLHDNIFLYYAIVFTIILANVLLIFLYFNAALFSHWAGLVFSKWVQKHPSFFEAFSFYSSRELFIILIFSLFRYVVFSMQFFLLLRAFFVPVDYFHAMILASIIFFIMAAIPTVLLTEIGVRGSVSIFVFGLYFTTATLNNSIELGILAASSLLWFINLAVPAMAGTFFVFRLKFFRKKSGI